MQAVMPTRGRKRAFGIASKIQLVGRIWICMSELQTRRRSLGTVAGRGDCIRRPEASNTHISRPGTTPAMTGKIAMAWLISDAAHRIGRGKTGPNAAGECQLQKPTYINRLLRRRRGSLPPYGAEAGGAPVWLETFHVAVAARYGAQKQAAELPNRGPARGARLGESRRARNCPQACIPTAVCPASSRDSASHASVAPHRSPRLRRLAPTRAPTAPSTINPRWGTGRRRKSARPSGPVCRPIGDLGGEVGIHRSPFPPAR